MAAKSFYTVGGTGRKIVEDGGKFKYVGPAVTKGERGVKPIFGNQTRINDHIADNTLRTI